MQFGRKHRGAAAEVAEVPWETPWKGEAEMLLAKSTWPASRRFWLQRTVAVLVVAAMLLSLPAAALGQEVVGRNGMVATADPLASLAGLEILLHGGNAVDAAVAAALAIGVVEPNASGLGGEGYMVIYLADTGEATAIDFRAAAPGEATYEAYPDGVPSRGWGAVAVPGTVAGLALALERYGTMTWEQVSRPAIRLAEEGFVVTETLEGVILDSYTTLLEDPELSSVYLKDGLPPMAGDVLRNENLAYTLRVLAEQGPRAFYEGEIAERIVAAVRAGGGLLSLEDMKSYTAIEREPARGTYRGYEILGAPPPVGGGVSVVNALQQLEHFDLSAGAPVSARTLHLITQATRRAHVDHLEYVADPAYWDVPVKGLTHPGYAALRAADIDEHEAGPMPQAGDPWPFEYDEAAALAPGVYGLIEEVQSPSTTHISVVDRWGNAVSLTQTLSSFFGAGVAVPGLGIALNNQMQNFAGPGHPNQLEPGKRPRTIIAPTIVLHEGRPFLVVGSPGAARILYAMVHILTNVIDFGMGIQEAIDAPRTYSFATSNRTEMEARIPEPVREELAAMGYTRIDVRADYDLYFGGAQAILIDPETGELRGGADPRRAGGVVAY